MRPLKQLRCKVSTISEMFFKCHNNRSNQHHTATWVSVVPVSTIHGADAPALDAARPPEDGRGCGTVPGPDEGVTREWSTLPVVEETVIALGAETLGSPASPEDTGLEWTCSWGGRGGFITSPHTRRDAHSSQHWAPHQRAWRFILWLSKNFQKAAGWGARGFRGESLHCLPV